VRKPLSFVPEKRLASILRRPGGLTADQAIAAASRRLESVRDTCLAALDEKIDALAAEPPTPESRGRLYALATEVFGLAGTFGVTELSQAAQSLCLLLANLEESGDLPAAYDGKLADSMRVHIDALRTLRRPELAGDAAARAAVVQGLRKVASRTAAPARTEPA
jgi:hypothetical protein